MHHQKVDDGEKPTDEKTKIQAREAAKEEGEEEDEVQQDMFLM